MFAESRANTNVHRLHAKHPPGDHFEFPVLAKLHPYGMLSYLATCSLYMENIL
jgi:hypothetical protein